MDNNLTPTYPSDVPVPIIVEGVITALRAMKLARSLGLATSYMPRGGDDGRRHIPVTHTVYLMGADSFAIARVMLEYGIDPNKEKE